MRSKPVCLLLEYIIVSTCMPSKEGNGPGAESLEESLVPSAIARSSPSLGGACNAIKAVNIQSSTLIVFDVGKAVLGDRVVFNSRSDINVQTFILVVQHVCIIGNLLGYKTSLLEDSKACQLQFLLLHSQVYAAPVPW